MTHASTSIHAALPLVSGDQWNGRRHERLCRVECACGESSVVRDADEALAWYVRHAQSATSEPPSGGW